MILFPWPGHDPLIYYLCKNNSVNAGVQRWHQAGEMADLLEYYLN
jgi:hypothetical protein